ncbi:RESISTANCE PROTEIN ADR1 putative-RELATED [Salix purpurea]|uniref:RESISTANCE PROTEIN ADR1 putative-RELATED n=1 Tax=Salix purpurea TaxID=77065 RepID=A0A9Q0ZMU9_SALPP|nr:RESISTANCE PROTEIN ADR1 putative-RELATED [Salix purpurea]
MAAQLAVSALSGAGFEIIFGDLLKMVLIVQKNNSQFKPSLERLQKMLEEMAPNIKRIESFNRELDQPKQLERLQGLMSDGKDLVLKCSKIHKYNCLKRPIYNKKLLKLEKGIRDHINIVLQFQEVADTKEILVKQNWTLVGVNNVSSGMKQLSNQVYSGVTQLCDEIVKLRMTISNGDRVDSSNSNIRLAGVCSPPLLKVDPVGFEIPLSELSIKLLKDETSQHIVLSAPGGYGKTTLATSLCQLENVKDKFKSNIFFLNVPKLRNLTVIVKMIFQHKDRQLPDFQSEEDAVNHLERLLKQIGPDPVLLVLDDVWPGSESILHKLKFRLENYKILVTSRYEFPSFGSTYKLETLNHADAVTLFQRLALPRDQQSYAPDQQTLEEMVKCCRGFPLVISVVGKSLCGKSAAEWRKRLRECYKAASILTEHEVLDCLQSSVEALNDNVVAKECFMDLGSFPEDQRIPATTLIDMWAELYSLDDDGAIANLHELSDRNLIEVLVTRKDANEDDGSYNEHFVTQHDLLRELAIRESNSRGIEHRKRVILEINENKIPEWLTEQNELSIRAKLLSISTDETFSSSWPSIQAPEVEVLLLNFQTGKYSLPEFIERMNKLKVLVLHNYGFVPAELSKFPLLGSLSSLKRIRLEKVSIPSLFLTSMKWRKLEKMSLVMCNIGQAFNKSTNKISDAFPKLVDLTIDYCNDLEELPTGFCDLVMLRKLSITNCHKLLALPEDMGNLLDLEILRLNSCIELTELPGTIGGLHKLQILDLSDCLSVTELPEQIGQLHNLRKLYMIECSSCELPSSVTNLFHLKEVIGDEETVMSWKRFKPCLPSLTIRVHKEINLNWLG